jgi:hypothetical protein
MVFLFHGAFGLDKEEDDSPPLFQTAEATPHLVGGRSPTDRGRDRE